LNIITLNQTSITIIIKPHIKNNDRLA
jgi:hypothetical protein